MTPMRIPDPLPPIRRTTMTVTWEPCQGCGLHFAYPYLCREHLLCGLCHPPLASSEKWEDLTR